MKKVPAEAVKPGVETPPNPVPAPQVVEIRGLDVVARAMEAATQAHERAAARLEVISAPAGNQAPAAIEFEVDVVERDSLGRIKRMVVSPLRGGRS